MVPGVPNKFQSNPGFPKKFKFLINLCFEIVDCQKNGDSVYFALEKCQYFH